MVLGILVASVAWGEEISPPPSSGTTVSAAAVAAKVNGQVIILRELEERLKQSRAEELSLYWLRQGQLQKMVIDLLLQQEAEKRGVSKAALVEEVTGAAHVPVSQEELDEYYEANAEEFPEGKQAAAEKIRNLIRIEKTSGVLHQFVESLGAKARLAIYLAPPPLPVGPHGEDIFVRLMLEHSKQKVQRPSTAAPPGVMAEVNGAYITAKALAEQLQEPLSQLGLLRRRLQEQMLERMIGEVLVKEEAEKKGLSVDELFETVTHASAIPVADAVVEATYQELKKSGVLEDEQKLKERIKQQLRRRQAHAQWEAFIAGLRAKAAIKTSLEVAPFSSVQD